MERVNSIFAYIEQSSDFDSKPIPKSEFQNAGFSPKDMDQWIDLIIKIQNSPRLILLGKGKRKYLDVRDNKFTLYMKKIFQDDTKDYEERKNAILLYFNALLTLEKLKGEYVDIESIIEESWELDKPTIVKLTEEAISRLNQGI